MQLRKGVPGTKKRIGSSLISFVHFRVDLTKVKFREPRECEVMISLECSYIITDSLSCLSPGKIYRQQKFMISHLY